MIKGDLGHGAETEGPTLDPRVAVWQSETAGADQKERAFAAIVEQFQGQLIERAAGIVGPDAAEDVVQGTFLRALSAFGRFEAKGEHGLENWLGRTTRNLALNTIRDTREIPVSALHGDHDHEGPGATVLDRQSPIGDPVARVELLEGMETLSRSYPTLGLVISGFTNREIAGMQGDSVASTGRELADGRSAARRVLQAA